MSAEEKQLAEKEKNYLTKILKRSPSEKELLDFRSTLVTLGKGIFQIHEFGKGRIK